MLQSKTDILKAIRLGRAYDGPLVSFPFSVSEVAPGVGAQYSWLLLRPEQNVVLQVDRVSVASTGAAISYYGIQFVSKKGFAGLAMAAQTLLTNVARTDASQAPTLGRSGLYWTSSVGAPLVLTGFGPTLWRGVIGAAGALLPDFVPPDPAVLFGDDTGEVGLGVFGPVNTPVTATFHGREWPLDVERYG